MFTSEEVKFLRKIINKEIKHKNLSINAMVNNKGERLETMKEVEDYYKDKSNGQEMIDFIKEEYRGRRKLEIIDDKLREMEGENIELA